MNSSTIKEVIVKVNGKDAEQRIANLQKMLDETKKKRDELNKKYPQGATWSKTDLKAYETLSKQIDVTQSKLNRLGIRAREAGDVLDRLSQSSVRDLSRTLKTLEKSLRDVPRGSEEWGVLTEAIRKTKEEIKKVNAEQEAFSSSNKNPAAEWGKKWVGLVTIVDKAKDAFTNAMQTIGEYAKEYAAMAEHTANVTKYTGLAKEEVDKLNESFKQMDTRTPREKLNDLAADAGRLGIQTREEVQEFVEAADQINTALGDDLGEDAVKNIGKLTQMFGTDKEKGLKQGMLSTASVINELAQSSSASEGYIMEFTNRLAGVGNQAGMTQAQLMGLASVMDQNQVAVEKGATAVQNVLTALFQNPAKMAKAAGLEVKQFTQLLKEDANAALLEFLQALQQTGGMDKLAPLLKEMNLSGAGVTQTLSTLSAKLADVKAAQEQANEAFEAGTSCSDEAQKANNSVQAGIEKTEKRLADLRVELGQRLLPVYTACTQSVLTMWKAILWLADAVKTIIQFSTEHARTIVTTTVAIATFTAYLKIHASWSKICLLADIAWTAAKNAWTAGVVRATAAQTAFNAAIKSNGFTAIISLILSAVAALATWIFMTDEATESAKKNSNATSENNDALTKQKEKLDAVARAKKTAADNTEKEKTKIEQLNVVLHDGNASYADRKAALEAIKQTVPAYHAQLTKEGKLERDNINAIRDYIQALDDKAEAQALFDELVEQKKKNRQLKKTLDTKQNNVDRVNNQLDNNWTLTEMPTPEDSPYHRKGSGNKKRDAKLQELKVQETARDKAQSDYNEGLREEAKLKQELNKPNLRKYSTQGEPTSSAYGSNSSSSTGHTSSGSGNSKTDSNDTTKKQLNQLTQQAETNKLAARMQYEAGIIEHREYAEQMLIIDEELYEAQRNLYKEGTPEWVQLEQKRLDAVAAERKQYNAWSIADINRQEEDETENIRDNYIHGVINEEQYQQALSDVKLKYLKQRADMSHDWGEKEDAEKYELQYNQASQEEKLKRHEDYLKKLNTMRNEYEQKSAAERMEIELKMLQAVYEATDETGKRISTMTEEEYNRLKKLINLKYLGTDGKVNDDGTVTPGTSGEVHDDLQKKADDAISKAQSDKASGASSVDASTDMGVSALASAALKIKANKEVYDNLKEMRDQGLIDEKTYQAACKKLDQERYENLQAVASAAYSAVSAIMSSASNLMQANASLEEAKVTKRYDTEIEKAGASTAKGKQLEEQKQKEIAKIKTKYNKKQMAMEIAQAIATTAMNAISAYGSMANIPVVGPILGAIAAAAATAAGMVQIATIKKQHAAEAAGYYEGGFTGGSSYRRTAGVVHEGEFVANHQAVSNPNVLPVLQLIDDAQRTNRIASLTATDVSRAIAAPMATASNTASSSSMQPMVQVVDTSREQTAETLSQLNERLNEGIKATVVIDGPDGLDRQWKRYNKMKEQ